MRPFEPDGTWRLRSPLGFVLHTLAPSDMRAINRRQGTRWFFTGAAYKVPQSWIEIELPDGRAFESLRSTPKSQAEALSWLDRLEAEHLR